MSENNSVRQCPLDPTCEHGPHDPLAHPCGRPAEKPGEPCRICGDPIPEVSQPWEIAAEVSPSCPRCWQPATPALLKAAFADHGITVDPSDGPGRFDLRKLGR